MSEPQNRALAGRFPKGVSGNPGGRPKGIAAIAREHTDKAVAVLVDALVDDDKRVAVTAAKELLDRGYGKPLTMTADVTNKLDDLDDESLSAALAAVRHAISAGTADDEGVGATGKPH
jgi:HEAT repeat protein